MYVRVLMLSAFLFSAVAQSQTQPQSQPQSHTCPVQINSFTGDSGSIHWTYTNASDKQITSLILDVDATNSLGEVEKLLVTPQFDIVENEKHHPFLPGVRSKTSYRNDNLDYGTYRVYVHGVKFSDGTVWRDDGSKSCALDGMIKH